MTEYIVVALIGFIIGAIWMGSKINDISKEKQRLRKENNHLKRIGAFHIGEVVCACRYNSFYMGEITKITHSESDTTIQLNNDEVFRICHIYTDKNEALQQIKI